MSASAAIANARARGTGPEARSDQASFSHRSDPQRGPGRLTNSAARTDLVLLIRRTVRPRGYASGFDSPAALLNGLLERPARGFPCVLARLALAKIASAHPRI